MSILKDLIGQIDNLSLQEQILSEVDELLKHKKFGLVYENHLPEYTPLYDIPIRIGSHVALKNGYMKDIYIVMDITDKNVLCENTKTHKTTNFNLDEIVAVAQFGNPIYPYLKPIDSISKAPDSDLWHILIEAENYHALQLLEYLFAEKVDCIYIDPPFNSGAKDWKYNNDYVDGSDTYKHSKWLSMLEKRLKLAKKLLNPEDSVLIIAIDEKEYLHLGCLLEDLFPEARIQMISSVINPGGSTRGYEFARTNEFIFFVQIGKSKPSKLSLGDEWHKDFKSNSENRSLRWSSLRRTGNGPNRKDRPNLFYPIFVDKKGTKILRIGESIPLEVNKETVKANDNEKIIWPILGNGEDGRWSLSNETLEKYLINGYVKLGQFTDNGISISYLTKGEQKKIEDGIFEIVGKRKDGSVIEKKLNQNKPSLPGSQWEISSHNASLYGSHLLNTILGKRKFDFPKSLYAVKDAISFFTKEKPNALILDFFAGSGTTLHAVNLLNAEDGGNRKCIIVTNNEVSEAESNDLLKRGLKPGDQEWEQMGIARNVTWPRTVCSIEGHDINGKPLEGNYIGIERPMNEGFSTNVAYFKLGFLDKDSVELGKQFKELLPVIWMKGGMFGPCPTLDGDDLPDMLILPKNHFAVLLEERSYLKFKKELLKHPEIETVFLITDSIDAFRQMRNGLEDKETYQLYRDYLDNFRINCKR